MTTDNPPTPTIPQNRYPVASYQPATPITQPQSTSPEKYFGYDHYLRQQQRVENFNVSPNFSTPTPPPNLRPEQESVGRYPIGAVPESNTALERRFGGTPGTPDIPMSAPAMPMTANFPTFQPAPSSHTSQLSHDFDSGLLDDYAAAQPKPVKLPRESSVTVRDVTFFRVLRSESLKLRSVASTWWLLAVAVALTIGMGALMGWTLKSVFENPDQIGLSISTADLLRDMSATTLATSGMQFMQLIIMILGVLYITNEYATGAVRATLTAVPKRSMVVIAKVVNLSVTVFLTSLASLYVAALIGWGFISKYGVDDRFTLQGLRVIAGASLANTLIALFAFAVGLLLGSTVGGISSALGTLLVLPIITSVLPWSWATRIGEYLIGSAATWLYNFNEITLPLSWQWNEWGFLKGLWVTGIWALVPLIAGTIMLGKRDVGSFG
jgi:ABC-2 type transport system permease protein